MKKVINPDKLARGDNMNCTTCGQPIILTNHDSPAFEPGKIYLCNSCGERLRFDGTTFVSQGKRVIGGIEAAVDRATRSRIEAASPEWDSEDRSWRY